MIRILLADDERLEREAFNVLLEGIDDEIILIGEAFDGNMAVALTEELQPDIIFMDVKMPKMDGLEAASIIEGKNRAPLIYLLCSYDLKELPDIKQGDHLYLMKPLRRSSLQHAISFFKKNEWSHEHQLGKLIGRLLEKIQLENYREAKAALHQLVQKLLLDFDGINEFQENVQICAAGMLKLFAAKGINDPSPAAYWAAQKELVTLYNAEEKLKNLLERVFISLMDNKSNHNEIQMIVNYIEMHYERGVSLEEVADFVHLTPQYVSRLFKRELETTFINYVTERRMERAKELLATTDMPVINIALELSYPEHSYFSKVFKKIVGITPMEYRKQFGAATHPYKRNTTILNGNWYI